MKPISKTTRTPHFSSARGPDSCWGWSLDPPTLSNVMRFFRRGGRFFWGAKSASVLKIVLSPDFFTEEGVHWGVLRLWKWIWFFWKWFLLQTWLSRHTSLIPGFVQKSKVGLRKFIYKKTNHRRATTLIPFCPCPKHLQWVGGGPVVISNIGFLQARFHYFQVLLIVYHLCVFWVWCPVASVPDVLLFIYCRCG